jgi:hypothetical protein
LPSVFLCYLSPIPPDPSSSLSLESETPHRSARSLANRHCHCLDSSRHPHHGKSYTSSRY